MIYAEELRAAAIVTYRRRVEDGAYVRDGKTPWTAIKRCAPIGMARTVMLWAYAGSFNAVTLTVMALIAAPPLWICVWHALNTYL